VDDEREMVGAEIELAAASVSTLFGESPSRIVISVRPERASEVETRAAAQGVPVATLGRTGTDRLTISAGGPVIDVALREAREARERCLEPIVGT
jgi:phosphoribosylformylglycinamidine synthase